MGLYWFLTADFWADVAIFMLFAGGALIILALAWVSRG